MMCPCQSQKNFVNCCGPIHTGAMQALTAERLMRSRYAAFVLADINYLMSSHHIATRPIKDIKAMLKWTKSVTWMGLSIVNCKAGSAMDSEGWVEFKATYMEDGRLQCIHENSYFVKEKGLWFYKSGKHN